MLSIGSRRWTRHIPAKLVRRSWAISNLPAAELWTQRVDVVHGTNFVVPPSKHGVELSTVHDLYWYKTGDPRSIDARIFRRMVERGTHFHVTTKAGADELQSLFRLPGDRIHVVPLGTPSVPLGSKADHLDVDALGVYILAVGDFIPRKNFVRLIEAFDLVAPTFPGVRLIIVGAPVKEPEFAAMKAAKDIAVHGDRIDFDRGWVSQEFKGALLRKARVLAYPSLEEGFGFPILEAQSVGIPVISGSCEALRETGGSSVTYIDPGNTSHIASALEVSLRGEGSGAVQDGFANSAKYDWAKSAEQMLEVYERVAAGNR